jgi:hypothetical protein
VAKAARRGVALRLGAREDAGRGVARAARWRAVAWVPDDRRVLEGIERLVVDGTNVLHALSRSAVAVPAASLIGRLRSIVPPGVSVVVVLDGSPEHGLVSRRVASGVEVRYAGRWSADEAIAGMVEREGYGSAGGLLVVTDDIELTGLIRRAGGRTVRNSWLMDRLSRQRLSAPTSGRPIPPAPGAGDGGPGASGGGSGGGGGGGGTGSGIGSGPGRGANPSNAGTDDSAERRWSPGRGATRKKGNAHRGRGPMAGK